MPRQGIVGCRQGFRILGLLILVVGVVQWYRLRYRIDLEVDEDFEDEDVVAGGFEEDAEGEEEEEAKWQLSVPVLRGRSAAVEAALADIPDAARQDVATAALLGSSKPSGASRSARNACSGNGVESIELSVGLSAKFMCSARQKSARLFVAITSPVGNFNLRQELRGRQWLMRKFPPQATYMFFVATSYDSSVQNKVEKEIKQYGDVVQLSFLDNYMNLAVKSFAAAAWAASQLDTGTVRYWLKVEDFMTNKWHLIDALVANRISQEQGGGQQPLYYGGGMIFGGTKVIRDGRWGCSSRHCPYNTYPVTYAGGQYLLSMSATTLLAFRGARGLNLNDPYPIEDHYVAETLLKAAGVRVTNDKALLWSAGKPYGAPSVVAHNFLLCLDTEERPPMGPGETAVWEGSIIAFPPGANVQRAWYGNPATRWTSNQGKDVTAIVRKKAAKKKSMWANAAAFGDPAPGVRKALIVQW